MKALLSSLLLLAATAAPVLADPVLSVISPGAETVELDWKAIEALPQTEVKTTNDYVEGIHSFSGPLLRDVFGDAKLAPADQIRLTALNDYAVTIPAADAISYSVILATKIDGAKMSVRDKGPIWVIYPMSEHEELRAPGYNDRLIWQLSKVELVPAK
ncbi:hypothetical protein V8J36_20120 [Frigidibacter sp. MR17.14]|uniref:molybdopterin-dependent oxidoreductase n=1 Tax=Frigidibacter sp. MR17.14 TaxID=3126509 RepID=UPI003012B15F